MIRIAIGRYQSYYRVVFAVKARQQHTAQAAKEKVEAKPFSGIPEPKKLPILGTLLDYTPLRNFNPKLIYEHIRKRHREVGSIFKETVVPGLTDTIVFTNSPEDTETIFRSDERLTSRNDMAYFKMCREKLGFPISMSNAEGEEWYKLRKVINEHLLKISSVWSYAKQHLEVGNDFADYIQRNLDENNEVPNFYNSLRKWSLEGAGVFIFDARLDAFNDKLDETVGTIMKANSEIFQTISKIHVSPPLWKYMDTKEMKYLRKLIVEQDVALTLQRKRIGEKLKGLGKWETAILESGLSPEDGRMLAADIFGASFDTTANAAVFLLYCLAMNPDKQEILRNEIQELLNNGEEITGKRMRSLRYMYACHREAQRMFPLIGSLPRETQKELMLSGYAIPPGTRVMVTSNICNNRDSKYYEDPDSFIPERWLTKQKENKFVMSGTFGHGPRMCPGRRFAMQELDCLMVALLSRYKVEYHHEDLGLGFRTVSVPLREPQFTFVQLNV